MSASTGCDAALWLCGSEKGRTMSAAVYRFYVGIDWATEKHRVVVLDAERRVVREREVCHEGAALESFADWLTQLAASAVETVAVALEVPRGAVVDVLLARGVHRFALNPKQLDRFRDRFTVAGAKDDRRDPQGLASPLAPALATLRRPEPPPPPLPALRAPALPVAPGTVQAAQRHLAVLLPRLRLIHQQRAECATQIEGLLERLGESQEHRDVPILRSVWASGESSPPRCSPKPRGCW